MEIKDITKETKKVEINAWVHEKRNLGGLRFIHLRDSTGMIQATVVKDKAPKDVLDAVSGLSKESVVKVSGIVRENPKSQSGLEIIPETFEVLVVSEPELPITVTEKKITTGLSKRLDWRCLDLRKPENQAIFRIQSAILEGMREYLISESFTQVFTPCIMGVASESGSEVFPIIYFNREAFLRQDPQLHRQLTIAGGMTKIFDIGPAWRAEQSHTNRHLCEHRVCAVESAFIKDEEDTMRIEEQVIISALTKVKKKCSRELELLGIDLKVPKAPFPVFTFPEIYKLLEEKGKHLPEGEDMDTEAEKILWEHVQKKHGVDFYFVKMFPARIKPFYVMRYDDMSDWARSVDMYYKGMEMSSGGQREHRHDHIKKNADDTGMPLDSIRWFTDFFRFGVPPHGGFAIGIERVTQQLLEQENIRECVLFPRDTERIVP